MERWKEKSLGIFCLSLLSGVIGSSGLQVICKQRTDVSLGNILQFKQELIQESNVMCIPKEIKTDYHNSTFCFYNLALNT